jgi:hypothetical protein
MAPKTYGWLVLHEKYKFLVFLDTYFAKMCKGVEANSPTF